MRAFRQYLVIFVVVVSACSASLKSDKPSAPLVTRRTPPLVDARPKAQQKIRTELYFGLSRSDGRVVKPKEWSAFVRDDIARRFPAGFTVVDAHGQWRDHRGRVVMEATKLLIVFHDGDAESERKLDEIVTAYKTRFGQEAVIRTSQSALLSP